MTQWSDVEIVRVEGRAVGFVRMTRGGFWRGHSYIRGCGFGPFKSIVDARTWVEGEAAKGPIPMYSRR